MFGAIGWKSRIIRGALWVALVATANANRRRYGFLTAWLFHLLGNSLVLWFPEFMVIAQRVMVRRLFMPSSPVHERAVVGWSSTVVQLLRSIATVSGRDRYAWNVAPLTVGYLASHPQFNIYKEPWSRLRLGGFGPDSLPHAATAFGFTRLVRETLIEVERGGGLERWALLRSVARRRALVTLVMLLGVTAFYEGSELIIYRRETRAADGDPSRVNMEWSVEDTVFDIASNLIGWALAWSANGVRHNR